MAKKANKKNPARKPSKDSRAKAKLIGKKKKAEKEMAVVANVTGPYGGKALAKTDGKGVYVGRNKHPIESADELRKAFPPGERRRIRKGLREAGYLGLAAAMSRRS